jgi:hypothetical protein
VDHNSEAVILRLEGKLIEGWVEEVAKAWERIASASGGQAIVDLTSVSFVDSEGRRLLRRMSRAGVRFTGSGPMINALIEEIEAPLPSRRRKRMLITLLLALSSFLISCVALAQDSLPSADSAPVLRLEDAVRLALDNNRSVKRISLEILKADDEIAVLKTRRLPATNVSVLGSQLLNEIAFTFEKGAFGTFPETGPIPAENTQITTPRRPNAYLTSRVTQPLSDLYKIKLGIRQAELGREAAKETVRAQQQVVVTWN